MTTGHEISYWKKDIQPYFVSNIDDTNLAEVFKKITPKETLFLGNYSVLSKTADFQISKVYPHLFW